LEKKNKENEIDTFYKFKLNPFKELKCNFKFAFVF